MKTMLKRIRSNEEGLDLVQLLIAVVILGFLIGIAALVLIGKAQDAKENSANASVANAVTATKVVLSEGDQAAQTSPAVPAIDVTDADSVASAVERALGNETGQMTIDGTSGSVVIEHPDGDTKTVSLQGQIS